MRGGELKTLEKRGIFKKFCCIGDLKSKKVSSEETRKKTIEQVSGTASVFNKMNDRKVLIIRLHWLCYLDILLKKKVLNHLL